VFNDGKEDFNAFFDSIWDVILEIQKGTVDLGILLYVIIFGTAFVIAAGVFGLFLGFLTVLGSVITALAAAGILATWANSAELQAKEG